jgi:hypothetical protein
MTTTSLHEMPTLDLLEIIDLKWLMAHEGHRVHVERLQTDIAYARHCLSIAAASPDKSLQAVARRIAARLDVDIAHE